MITFSEIIDKKTYGQPGQFRLLFLSPNPSIPAAAGLPRDNNFSFSPCGKMSFFAEILNAIVIEN